MSEPQVLNVWGEWATPEGHGYRHALLWDDEQQLYVRRWEEKDPGQEWCHAWDEGECSVDQTPTEAIADALALLEHEGLVVGKGTYRHIVLPIHRAPINDLPVLVIRDPRKKGSDEPQGNDYPCPSCGCSDYTTVRDEQCNECTPGGLR